jgi:hypothetical protein
MEGVEFKALTTTPPIANLAYAPIHVPLEGRIINLVIYLPNQSGYTFTDLRVTPIDPSKDFKAALLYSIAITAKKETVHGVEMITAIGVEKGHYKTTTLSADGTLYAILNGTLNYSATGEPAGAVSGNVTVLVEQ